MFNLVSKIVQEIQVPDRICGGRAGIMAQAFGKLPAAIVFLVVPSAFR